MSKVKFIKSYWSQFLAVGTATLGSLSNGMEYGWSSPAVPNLMSNGTYIPITHDDSFWLETLYVIAAACSLPLSFIILQYLGRRRSILISGSFSLLAWLLIATSNSVSQLFAARAVSGIGASIAFSAIPMYIAEISEPNIRGFFGALVYTMSLIGILVVYCIVPFLPIYASALVGACVSFLQVSTFYWQPESPYYLLTKSKEKEMKKMLTRLRCPGRNIEKEMELIAKAVARQKTERGRPIDIIKTPSNRKAFLIVIVLQPAQNMLGIAVITMNLHVILGKYETAITSQTAAVLFSLTTLVSSFIGSILIDRFGRKVLLITSALLTSLCLAALGGYFAAQDYWASWDMADYQWVPFVTVIAYAFCFKFGAGLVPVVVPAEILPISIKSMGMTFAIFCLTLSATISIQIYYVTVEAYGMYFPFLLFSLFGILFALFVSYYVPETKGKTLEEIQIMLKGRRMSHIEKQEMQEVRIK